MAAAILYAVASAAPFGAGTVAVLATLSLARAAAMLLPGCLPSVGPVALAA